MRAPSPRAAVSLSLLLCTLWFFAPLIFLGQVIFERDVFSVWHAQIEAIVRAVGEGSLPLWDPHASFGEPLMEFAAQILYPPTWLALIMPAGAFYSLSVVGHHLFGGAGLYLFLRAQGLSRVSSAFGASLWMSSGPLHSVVNMLNLFCGAAWMPWVLLAADRARRSGSSSAAVLWGASVAACMLPGAETVLMAGLASGAFFLTKRSLPRRLGRLTWLAAQAFVVALLLAAAQWIPLVALLRRTSRADLPHWVRTFWSLHPLALLQVPFPVFFQDLPLQSAPDLGDVATPLFASVFIGAPALALAAAGAFSRWRRGGLFFSGISVLGILFALGRHAHAYDLIVGLLPMLRSVRYPVKAMLLVSLSLAVLAAFGLEAVRGGERGAKRCCASVVLGLWLGLLTAGFFSVSLLEDLLRPRPNLSPQSALLVLTFQLGIGLAASLMFLAVQSAAVQRRLGRAASLALALLAIVQPVLAHRSLNAMAPESVLRYRPPVVDAIRKDGGTRVFSRTRPRDTVALVLRQVPIPDGFPPPLATVLNYKQILLPDVARIFALSSSYEVDIRGAQSVELARLSLPVLGSEDGPWVLRMLQLGAVTHAITLDPRVPPGLELLRVDRTLLGNSLHLYRVPSPLARCYVVGGVRAVDGDAAIGTLLSPGFDPLREVVIPDVPARPPASEDAGTCRVVGLLTSRVEAEVSARSDAFVVLVDAYSPSWRASVDGVPTPVHRANVAFRAVAVPAGRHSVVLRYAAPTVWLGLALTLAGLVLAAVVVVVDRRTVAEPGIGD